MVFWDPVHYPQKFSIPSASFMIATLVHTWMLTVVYALLRVLKDIVDLLKFGGEEEIMESVILLVTVKPVSK